MARTGAAAPSPDDLSCESHVPTTAVGVPTTTVGESTREPTSPPRETAPVVVLHAGAVLPASHALLCLLCCITFPGRPALPESEAEREQMGHGVHPATAHGFRAGARHEGKKQATPTRHTFGGAKQFFLLIRRKYTRPTDPQKGPCLTAFRQELKGGCSVCAGLHNGEEGGGGGALLAASETIIFDPCW